MKNIKRVKGYSETQGLTDDGDGRKTTSVFAVVKDPTMLREDQGYWPPRDHVAERKRAEYLSKFVKALKKLTPRQRLVIDTLEICKTQEEAALRLNVKQSTIANTLIQIQKKINKVIDKIGK